VFCFKKKTFYFQRKERKDLKLFHVVPIFTELGQDLTHLAHKENTQSDIFWTGEKFYLHFVLLGL
jgi:hypothetical protein